MTRARILSAGLIAMLATPVSYYKRSSIQLPKVKLLDFDKLKAAEAKRLRKQQRNLKNNKEQ